jgi:hypothetical protein
MFSNASTIRSRAFYDAARTEKREDLDKVCAGGAGHFRNSVKPVLYGKKLFCGHSLSSPLNFGEPKRTKRTRYARVRQVLRIALSLISRRILNYDNVPIYASCPSQRSVRAGQMRGHTIGMSPHVPPRVAKTYLFVRKRALDNPLSLVRRTSLEALAAGWTADPSVRSLVRERASGPSAERPKRALAASCRDVLEPGRAVRGS